MSECFAPTDRSAQPTDRQPTIASSQQRLLIANRPKNHYHERAVHHWVAIAVTITPISLKAELNEKGWRMTPQRQTILTAFQDLQQGKHLSVEDLHFHLSEAGHDISLATIYRTVKLMARMGILRELELAEGHKHYELNTATPHHHHHMVCVQCSRTLEFENDTVLKQSMKQVEKSGYQLIDCQLTIYAICPEAIRYGYPALPSEDWMCTKAIADKEKHPKKSRNHG